MNPNSFGCPVLGLSDYETNLYKSLQERLRALKQEPVRDPTIGGQMYWAATATQRYAPTAAPTTAGTLYLRGGASGEPSSTVNAFQILQSFKGMEPLKEDGTNAKEVEFKVTMLLTALDLMDDGVPKETPSVHAALLNLLSASDQAKVVRPVAPMRKSNVSQ